MQRGSSKRRVAPKRTVNFQAAPSSSNIKVDAQGKVIADQDPAKKFPLHNPEFAFVEEYQRNIEDAAQRVRSTEASQSAEPSRLIDNMKATPLQTLRGSVESMLGLWGLNEEADGPDAAFYKDCCAALDADLSALKQMYKPLSKIAIPSNISDPLDAVPADSRGLPARISSFNQLPPPIRALTCTLRDLEHQRQQRVIVSKGLDYSRKKKALADLRVDVGKQVAKIAREDRWNEKNLNFKVATPDLVDVARMTLSGPFGLQGSSSQKKLSSKRSLISLYQFLMARRFPDGLRSAQFKSHAEDFMKTGRINYGRFNQGYSWTIEDSAILKSVEKYKDLIELKITTDEDRELMLANITNILGLAVGYNYRNTLALKEFRMILQSFGVSKDLEFAEDIAVRPRSRALRASVNAKLQEKTAGKQSVQVTQSSTAEVNDSDEDNGEREQRKKEQEALNDFLTSGPQLMKHGLATGFGSEHVHIRLGGDYGRLRNNFDINRAKDPILEALPQPIEAEIPMIYESSEDENIPFADLQRKYRKRYRLLAHGRGRVEDESVLEEWPGSALSAYKQRIRDQVVKQESPNKRKKVQPPSQWRGQTYTLNADGEKVVVEECWKTLSIKPRVRMFESRFDRGGSRALGFSALARDLSGSEKQLIGIDESEFHRRFALNKLWQVKMIGRDHLLANRRYFALILDEDNGLARVVNAHPTKLIHSDSPNQALRDFNWELYWRGAKDGKIQNRNEARRLRYERLKSNNYVIWKDGLEKYQKLRERVSELQTHENPRDMKLKILTRAPTIALNEIPLPPSQNDTFSKPAPLTDWVDRNIKEIEFKKKIALRTRNLLTTSNRRAAREFKTLYKEARRCIAERSLYEQSWISNKAKRSTEATLAAASPPPPPSSH